jgi:predicted secreted protein
VSTLALYLLILGVEAVLFLAYLPMSLRAKRAELGELPNIGLLVAVNVINLAWSSAVIFAIVQVIAHSLTGHFI